MSWAARIRLYLIAVALLPPILIMAVIYFHSVRQVEDAGRRQAVERLARFAGLETFNRSQVARDAAGFADADNTRRAAQLARAGRPVEQYLDPRPFALDFAELLDSAGYVVAAYHRPGLLGERLNPPPADSTGIFQSVEIDLNGPHPAWGTLLPTTAGLSLYTGRYLGPQFVRQAEGVLDASVRTVMTVDSAVAYAAMQPGRLYELDRTDQAVLAGSADAGYFLVATFASSPQRPLFLSLLKVTGAVAVASILLAVGLSIIITNRARREIDNLIDATSRVAEGDFTTPVMAYEEGEFSQLADSFSSMMARLTDIQRQLATAQKIAAWQVVGRKIAHELKNPLTPIAIGADDLRRSYKEKQPHFDRILIETTTTIKSEVNRLTRLLDEFVGFARMAPPEVRRVDTNGFISSVEGLYRPEIASGRLAVTNLSRRSQVRLDPQALLQVLVNLIKNGLEAAADSTVAVKIEDRADTLAVTVEDTGPGFSDDRLDNPVEPFSTTKPGGSGIGLVIAYRIAHDHGGDLRLYNTQTGGAGVLLTIPQ